MSESKVLGVVILYCRNHSLYELQKYHQISIGQSRRNNSDKITLIFKFLMTGVQARDWGLQPPWLGQSHYFLGKSKIFRTEASSQNWKNIFLYLLNEKNGIHKATRIRDFY